MWWVHNPNVTTISRRLTHWHNLNNNCVIMLYFSLLLISFLKHDSRNRLMAQPPVAVEFIYVVKQLSVVNSFFSDSLAIQSQILSASFGWSLLKINLLEQCKMGLVCNKEEAWTYFREPTSSCPQNYKNRSRINNRIRLAKSARNVGTFYLNPDQVSLKSWTLQTCVERVASGLLIERNSLML